MAGEYARTVRAMQSATRNVDRSFTDTDGWAVVAPDGTVLLAFTASPSRARRMQIKHPGSTITPATR